MYFLVTCQEKELKLINLLFFSMQLTGVLTVMPLWKRSFVTVLQGEKTGCNEAVGEILLWQILVFMLTEITKARIQLHWSVLLSGVASADANTVRHRKLEIWGYVWTFFNFSSFSLKRTPLIWHSSLKLH